MTAYVELGDFKVSNFVWNHYVEGKNLAEKLAIEQVISEGNGLDVSSAMIEKMKHYDVPELLHVYEYLISDETFHCRFGVRWIKWLCQHLDEWTLVL